MEELNICIVCWISPSWYEKFNVNKKMKNIILKNTRKDVNRKVVGQMLMVCHLLAN